MSARGRIVREYGSLGVMLMLTSVVAVATISSCGGGGGSSNGGLCEQCGVDPDGPCQQTVFVDPAPDAPDGCNQPGADPTPCPVNLDCFRKLGSAQRRCFPLVPGSAAPQPLFRCDGARANASTPVPTDTPTVTVTAQPTPTDTGPTPIPTFTPF